MIAMRFRQVLLKGRGGFQLCPVCFREDGGQDDHDAAIQAESDYSVALCQS